ncbi:MAG TPA: hypothetical protein VI172_12540 [Candidatus Dormibacteraeota bacterium]
MKGQRVCGTHGGSSPQAKKAAERRLQASSAQQAVATFGLAREIDPRDALLEEVYRTAGAVDWLARQVQALNAQDIVWGRAEETDDGVKDKAAPSIWVQLYQTERKHLVDVARVAIAAGIEERKVRLAEQQGAMLAGVIKAILGDLDLTPEQQAMVSTVVPRHLRAVA